MNTYQTNPGYSTLGNNWWDTKDTQDDRVLLQRFQSYDKNRDGLLEKSEFRSMLKDLFSSQTSNQFLEDAIEETVWRVPTADFVTAKNAISLINSLRGESQPTPAPLSKPFNAQGQQMPPSSTASSQQIEFNPFNLPPPPVATPLPVDLTSLPPPMAPLRFSQDMPSLPPPPIANMGGVGGLKKPALPTSNAGARPLPPIQTDPAKMAPQSNSLQAKSMPAKPPAKVAAKPPVFIPPTQEMLQEKMGPTPVRVLPMGQAKPGLNSAAAASEEESRAFVEYINTSVAMQQDPDVKGFLPISAKSTDIYTIVSDGWLLCKLLNAIQSDLIPSAQIKLHPKNAFEKIENHTLALQAARKLGCKTVNIGPEDLLQGKPRLVLGLLWQIIKRDVLSKVSLAQHPEIYKLARNSNNLKEISDCSPEEVLLKWANHHLQSATKGNMQITNLSKDVKDGTAYTLLMHQIAPQVCNTDALQETDIRKRAQMIVDNAKRLDCDRFVTPNDIVNGNDKLNLAFVADLFNKHSGLELPTLEEMERLKKQNSSMSKILDEAEARLRQILADGQLAHELQQEEILLYRQRKLKEQEQLAEQEAMLRSQLKQEELMLLQQQRMKDMKLQEQESFARQEQRKEESRVANKRPVSSYANTSSSLAKPASTSSSSASRQAPSVNASQAAAPAHPPHPTYSAPTSTPSYPPSTSSYSSTAPAYPSATPSYPSSTSSYSSATPSYPPSTSSYPSTASYYPPSAASTAPTYSTPAAYPPTSATSSAYPSATSSAYPTYSAPPAAQSYSTTTQSYTAPQGYTSTNYSNTPVAPNPYNVTPAYSAPNPYNTAYPPAPSYPAYPADQNSSYVSSTQTVYTEAPVASYPDPTGDQVAVRRRGMFERVGKKIDRAFH